MRVEYLNEARRKDFINYCRQHRNEVDESFLGDSELDIFKPDQENPTYIVINEHDEIIAAASLIINSYFLKGKRGRFRIFHSTLPNKEIYESMLKNIIQYTKNIDIERMFMFIDDIQRKHMEMVEAVHFQIERYVYLLERDDMEVEEPQFPDGYHLKTFHFNQDEEDYCYVRNISFANLQGNEIPITPDKVKNMKDSDDYLEGGIKLLYHGEKPVGVVRAAKENHKNSLYTMIGPIAIIPTYQGLGLGKNLLRVALKHGKKSGIPKAYLVVNADNVSALKLYLNEGFLKDETVICYNYPLK